MGPEGYVVSSSNSIISAKSPENFLDILIAKAISLQGSFSHTWSSWEAVLQLVSSGKLMMEPMITHRFPLDKWEEAFELMDNKSAVKALIYPTS